MMKVGGPLMVLLALCSCAAGTAGTTRAFFPVPAETPTRYIAAVFEAVDVTRNIVYAEGRDFTGKRVQLRLDRYEPHGDSAAMRGRAVFPSPTGLTGRRMDAWLAAWNARESARRKRVF